MTPRDRAEASRAAQGLPAKVHDPTVLARAAALLGQAAQVEKRGAA
jgi:hypothetical protein